MTNPNLFILDFKIQSKPLSEKQEQELSKFIAKRKREIKKMLKRKELARKSSAKE